MGAASRRLSVADRMATGASIAARALTKTFGVGDEAHHALGPVDFRIEPGEFVSLIGPSGWSVGGKRNVKKM